MRIRKLIAMAVVLLALGASGVAVTSSPAAADIPDPYDVALIFRVHTGDAVQHWPYSSVCAMNSNAVIYGSMYKHDLSTWHYRLHYLWADGHWDNVAVSSTQWNNTCPGPYPG